MNKNQLIVRYSCIPCGLIDIEVPVMERNADDDIKFWFEKILTPALGVDHLVRSPGCKPKTLSNVKIPLPDGANRVGGLPEH